MPGVFQSLVPSGIDRRALRDWAAYLAAQGRGGLANYLLSAAEASSITEVMQNINQARSLMDPVLWGTILAGRPPPASQAGPSGIDRRVLRDWAAYLAAQGRMGLADYLLRAAEARSITEIVQNMNQARSLMDPVLWGMVVGGSAPPSSTAEPPAGGPPSAPPAEPGTPPPAEPGPAEPGANLPTGPVSAVPGEPAPTGPHLPRAYNDWAQVQRAWRLQKQQGDPYKMRQFVQRLGLGDMSVGDAENFINQQAAAERQAAYAARANRPRPVDWMARAWERHRQRSPQEPGAQPPSATPPGEPVPGQPAPAPAPAPTPGQTILTPDYIRAVLEPIGTQMGYRPGMFQQMVTPSGPRRTLWDPLGGATSGDLARSLRDWFGSTGAPTFGAYTRLSPTQAGAFESLLSAGGIEPEDYTQYINRTFAGFMPTRRPGETAHISRFLR